MTLAGKPRSLIINRPYLRPEQHWGDAQSDGSLPIVPERRRAGYEIFDPRKQSGKVHTLRTFLFPHGILLNNVLVRDANPTNYNL